MSSTSTGPSTATSPRSAARIVAFLALTAGFVVAAIWRPSESGIPMCFMKLHTGLACPGCGMTRAVCALAHGEVGAALKYHAFSVAVAAAAVAAWGALGLGFITRRNHLPPLDGKWSAIGVLSLAGGLILYWLVRILMGATP